MRAAGSWKGVACVLLGIALLGGALLGCTRRPATTPAYVPTLPEAQAAARQSGGEVLLVFVASWCDPCSMAERAIAKSEAKKLLEGVELVRVDVEDPNQADIVTRYGGPKLPRLVLLDADGRVRGVTHGFGGSEFLLEELTRLRQGTADDDPAPGP